MRAGIEKAPPTILLAAVGTASDAGRSVYSHIEAQVRLRFPDHPVAWAFTSRPIRERLARQGVTTHAPAEAIAQLRSQGQQRIVLQSLHVLAGDDYAQVVDTVDNDPDIELGAPLLADVADIPLVLDSLTEDLCPERPCVLVAHGHPTDAHVARLLAALDVGLAGRWPNAVVASLTGPPGLDNVQRLQVHGQVRFIPFMLTQGRHWERDIIGPSPSSLVSRLDMQKVETRPSLGWNPKIIELFLRRLEETLERLK